MKLVCLKCGSDGVTIAVEGGFNTTCPKKTCKSTAFVYKEG